jgi:glycosyltransferase involved in cell wall biosynthesis
MEGVAPTTVHVVGPLVAGRDMRPFVGHTTTDSGQMSGWPAADDVCSRAKVIIFSNRGGDDYLRVLEHLSVRSDDVDVVFVGYDDPELVGRAMGGRPPARWRFHTRLTQAEYFRYLDEAGAAQGAFLISKSGPNTTLESAYFGIPVLMLESGLPMEAWVGGLIHDRGLGQCCDGADELISVLDTWLADPAYVQRHKNACQNFAVGTLNQTVTARRIGDLMRILLGQGTGGAQAAWTPETTMSKRA